MSEKKKFNFKFSKAYLAYLDELGKHIKKQTQIWFPPKERKEWFPPKPKEKKK